MIRQAKYNIKVLQDIKNGNTITLGEHQTFFETSKSYEIWDASGNTSHRIISISKKRIGFVYEK